MTAFTRFAQFIGRAAGNNLFTEIDKVGQEGAQGQLLWSSTVQGQHVTAKGCLHRRKAIQLVQYNLGRRIAF